MSFESLSQEYEVVLPDFPREWVPLTYLYDPDLPLFPLLYFHLIDPLLGKEDRPGHKDRVYGFVRHISVTENGLIASLVLNKDLNSRQGQRYRVLVENEVRQRLGMGNPVRLADIRSALIGPLEAANKVLAEIWYQIVETSFGKSLPFGRMWDGIFGLPRFIASWNSQGGRKGELIQTHFYLTSFGERISNGHDVHADFYLLPTFEEVANKLNPLHIFPKFRDLIDAADDFVAKFCDVVQTQSGAKMTAFRMSKTGQHGQLDTKKLVNVIDQFEGNKKRALFENYNAFNRGPPRAVLSLLMHHDLRNGYWDPRALTPKICAEMYSESGGSYQSPKVMQLYAQQCFGATNALPIDNWVLTFLESPLAFKGPKKNYHQALFSCSTIWGKIERVIWMASQARKVHSSSASEILWCVRYGGPEKKLRGANPFACKICEQHVREVCPAYAEIQDTPVAFNSPASTTEGFRVDTSEGNNTVAHQSFVRCTGKNVEDQYSPRDKSEQFKSFPALPHSGENIRVSEFIAKY